MAVFARGGFCDGGTAMIFDCFTFFNELDLLEVRLRELAPAVDAFVLVEATRTHAGAPKRLFFDEAKQRFAEFLPKIRHVIVDDMPVSEDPWVLENHQRRAILRGLPTQIRADDIVIVSDTDEILRRSVVAALPAMPHQVFGFRLPLSYFRFNYRHTFPPVLWAVAVRGQLLTRYDPQQVRDSRFWLSQQEEQGSLPAYATVIADGGWHFSYLGNDEHVANKIRNYAHHVEANVPRIMDRLSVPDLIARRCGVDPDTDNQWTVVEIDGSFPEAVQADRDRFRHLIV